MAMAKKWLASFAALSLGLAAAACRVEDAPEQPIANHLALCCKSPGSEALTFTGCRPSNHCRSSESVWLRGPVACGPVEADRCEGGRCCALEVETPARHEPALVGTPIEHAPDRPPERPLERPPEPAAIDPVPFESP